MTVTRFAPSPNGSLHLGHAFAAIVAHDLAQQAGGKFLLRIEDIDGTRSKPELAAEFRKDLAWLGLKWEEVPAQSTRLDQYVDAAKKLTEQGLVYPCQCSRAEIMATDPAMGPEGPIYPGTCKGRSIGSEGPIAWRLDVARAMEVVGALEWTDELAGLQQAHPELLGDVVLVRKDEPASYHLAATIDDASDGVTLVTRGEDLFHATHIHRLLQALLGLPAPRWRHHALLLDDSGRKLAKRRGSAALSDRRASGEDGLLLAEQLRVHLFPAGISLGSA